jgi:hypothetical protein
MLVLVALLGVTAGAQTQIANARIETREATQGLDREIQMVADRGVAAWIAYRTPTVRGPQHMCSSRTFTSSRVMLEPATELTVLVRVEDRRVVKLQVVTPDCEVDAGNLPVVWLNGVSAAESAAWLGAQITSAGERGRPESRVVQSAISALVWHQDQGVPLLIQIARTHRNREVQRQAMFWLARSKDPRAVAFFEELLR